MQNLKEYCENCVKTVAFPVTAKNNINQNVRNQLRASLLEQIQQDLIDTGFECYREEKGIAIAIPNDELGVIPMIVSITLPSLDYDYEERGRAYADSIASKVTKLQEMAAKPKQ